MGSNIKIHLATFHQNVFSIYDQIMFFKLLFKYMGIRFSFGGPLQPECLNLIIEDFSPSVCEIIERFHEATGKRVAIIATEHLDHIDGVLLGYGEKLFAPENNRDYVTHAERARRFAGLVRASHAASLIFTLGDYPHLHGMQAVFPRCRIVSLPFPPLSMAKVAKRALAQPRFDFVFTGSPTPFRERILGEVGAHFSLAVNRMGANLAGRARMYASAALALNIPQYQGWVWSSPMRILYGMTMGRLTISPFLRSDSAIDQFTFMTDVLDRAYLDNVLRGVTPQQRLERIEAYQAFAIEQVRASGLDRILAGWADREALS